MHIIDRARDEIRGWARRAQFSHVRSFCAFVGYPRSGHSLIGALLNAHPRVVLAHELDAVGLVVDRGYSRAALFSAIFERDEWWKARAWQWEGWDYTIPGHAQGIRERVEVIGDKAGGLTARQICRNPKVLRQVAGVAGVPVRLLHHVRHPLDTIATMSRKGQPGVDSVDSAISRYFDEHAEGVRIAKAEMGDSILDLHHESLMEDPDSAMSALLAHVDLTPPEGYLAACRARINPTPTASRHAVEWKPKQRERVRSAMTRFAWLARYADG